jgi:hypothetical protein
MLEIIGYIVMVIMIAWAAFERGRRVEAQGSDLGERLILEKNRRIYYQGIVYDVCNELDKISNRKTVCGTHEAPSNDVQEAVEVLIMHSQKTNGRILYTKD